MFHFQATINGLKIMNGFNQCLEWPDAVQGTQPIVTSCTSGDDPYWTTEDSSTNGYCYFHPVGSSLVLGVTGAEKGAGSYTELYREISGHNDQLWSCDGQ